MNGQSSIDMGRSKTVYPKHTPETIDKKGVFFRHDIMSIKIANAIVKVNRGSVIR